MDELEFWDTVTPKSRKIDWSTMLEDDIELFIRNAPDMNKLITEIFIKLIQKYYIQYEDKVTKVIHFFIPVTNDTLYVKKSNENTPSDFTVVNSLKKKSGYLDLEMNLRGIFIDNNVVAFRHNHESGIKYRMITAGTITNFYGIQINPQTYVKFTELNSKMLIDALYDYIVMTSNTHIPLKSFIPYIDNVKSMEKIIKPTKQNVFSIPSTSLKNKQVAKYYYYANLGTDYDNDGYRRGRIFRSKDNGFLFYNVMLGKYIGDFNFVELKPFNLGELLANIRVKLDIVINHYQNIFGEKLTNVLLDKYNEGDKSISELLTKKEKDAINNRKKQLKDQQLMNSKKDSIVNKIKKEISKVGTRSQKIASYKRLWKYCHGNGKVVTLDPVTHIYSYIKNNELLKTIFACEHEIEQYINNKSDDEIVMNFAISHDERETGEYACCRYCGAELELIDNSIMIEIYKEENAGSVVGLNASKNLSNYYELYGFLEFAYRNVNPNTFYTELLLRNIVQKFILEKETELITDMSSFATSRSLTYWTLLYAFGIVTLLLIDKKLTFKLMTLVTKSKKMQFMFDVMFNKKNEAIDVTRGRCIEDFKNAIEIIRKDPTATDKLTIVEESPLITENLINAIETLPNFTVKSIVRQSPLADGLRRTLDRNPRPLGKYILPVVNYKRTIKELRNAFYFGINSWFSMNKFLPYETMPKCKYHQPHFTQYDTCKDGNARKISTIIINGIKIEYNKYQKIIKYYENMGKIGIFTKLPYSFSDLYSGKVELFDGDIDVINLPAYTDKQYNDIKNILINKRNDKMLKEFNEYFCVKRNVKTCNNEVFDNYLLYVKHDVIYKKETFYEIHKKNLDKQIKKLSLTQNDYKKVYQILGYHENITNPETFVMQITQVKTYNIDDIVMSIKSTVDSMILTISSRGYSKLLTSIKYASIANDIFNSNIYTKQERANELVNVALNIILKTYKEKILSKELVEILYNEFRHTVNSNEINQHKIQMNVNNLINEQHIKLMKMTHVEKSRLGIATGTLEDNMHILLRLVEDKAIEHQGDKNRTMISLDEIKEEEDVDDRDDYDKTYNF